MKTNKIILELRKEHMQDILAQEGHMYFANFDLNVNVQGSDTEVYESYMHKAEKIDCDDWMNTQYNLGFEHALRYAERQYEAQAQRRLRIIEKVVTVVFFLIVFTLGFLGMNHLITMDEAARQECESRSPWHTYVNGECRYIDHTPGDGDMSR